MASTLVRVGQRAHRYLTLRSVMVAALLIFVVVLLGSCNQLFLGNDQARDPDVFDKVRSLDLLPRFPREVEPAGRDIAGRAKPAVYGGVEVSALSTPRAQSAAGGDGYELNFENTPIATLAKVVLGDILATGYSIDPRVQGTVSLASGRPVPKSDILYVLENALRLSGVVIIRDTAGYRLVPLGDAVGAGNMDSAAARAEPGYGISVVPLQYVSAQTLIKLLDSFATKPGTVRADTSRNMLLVQGSGAERRAAIETVLSFDVDWMRGQSVGVYPVQNSNPEPIIAELEKILDSGEGGLSQNVIKFQPVGRMNAILVVTRKPDLLRAASNWIARLDNADTMRTGVHVYRVKFGEARQMARVLNDIYVGGASNSLDTPASQVAPGSGLATTSSADRLSPSTGQTASSVFPSRQQAGMGGSDARGFGATQSTLGSAANNASANALDARSGSSGGQAILQGVRITADVVNNALLIYSSQENYQTIERTLHQIDRPQLQVGIDATVAEVTLNNNLSYGVQFFLQSQNLGLKPERGSLLNLPSSPPGAARGVNAAGVASAFLNRAFPGFNFLVGPEAQPNVILDALHAVTDLKVLSNPSLVVIDNQVATLMVGDDVPISTGTANVLTTSNTIVNTIDYRSTGIILRVVPRINVNGHVRLDIEQEISQVSNASNSTISTPNLTPTVSQRKVKSSISVASGQTVLLAGLIQERKEADRGGIPLLDQIPGLGDAFSHQSTTVVRTELIIFIRPQIIRDSVDAHFVAEELRTKLRGTIGASAPIEPARTLR
jgi:general secretion pathway protein D